MPRVQPQIVLLAGGGGERFWPRSRPDLPKQFLDLDGSGSLLYNTYRRALGLAAPSAIFVATRAEYAELVTEHLPDLPAENLILEPEGRDTAPCLGLAALVLGRRDPMAIMVALPADHFIADEQRFVQTLRAAADVAHGHAALVTLGIRPTRPETGYGYVQVGEVADRQGGLSVHRVQRFVEKPDAATAVSYLKDATYRWNGGMFAWQVGVLRQEIACHLPALAAVLDELDTLGDDAAMAAALPTLYPQAPKVSIDYGVLEKSKRVLVIPADFGWDDVGTWTAVGRLRPTDADGNAARGPAVLIKSRNVLVEAEQRVVAALGVEDLVVVDSEEGVLVCHKSQAQAVREVAAQARLVAVPHPLTPPQPEQGRVVEKPWGREIWWADTDHYLGKLIEVRSGHSLSRQYHAEKLETLYFQRGRGRLLVGDKWRSVGPGSVVTLVPGTVHQLEALTDLTLIEVSTPHPEDVIRVADRYGRVEPDERADTACQPSE